MVAATSDRDFEAAFGVIVQPRAQVLLISTDPFLAQSADRIIALAAQHRIPAVYATSESVAGGGLNGASISNAWRLGGDAAPERIPAQGCGGLVPMAPVLELARE